MLLHFLSKNISPFSNDIQVDADFSAVVKEVFKITAKFRVDVPIGPPRNVKRGKVIKRIREVQAAFQSEPGSQTW